ncbi:AAA family ATPase [Akkermansia sp.]|uniref:AAA family ATPase n=1 Tax=Akkermansia sp. TaxID=1872421 RepID=UPI003A86E02D
MIHHLQLTNVGPSKSLKIDFGARLNLITGDNGLGKSFLLDVAWWAMTRKWPEQINPGISAGDMARPSFPGMAAINFSIEGKSKKKISYESTYDRKAQSWVGKSGRPLNPGLILYAMSDGSFAIWDPARNYWKTSNKIDVQDRPPAYVFDTKEIWDGLPDAEGKGWYSNGIIRDWAGWQKESGEAWKQIQDVLLAVSPRNEQLKPGKLTRISLDDVRDMPTLSMPYGIDVPLLHVSAGIRRIIALTYCLVWAWQEHTKAAELLDERPAKNVVFLIDEIEAHLHPQWQRTIVRSLIQVMNKLTAKASIQLILTTHSPLVMGSCEDFFDDKKDRWQDLDFVDGSVQLTTRNYEKQGNACNWLQSPAFDLTSTRSLDTERLIKEAEKLLQTPLIPRAKIEKMSQDLADKLNPKDDFLFRWRYLCSKKNFVND